MSITSCKMSGGGRYSVFIGGLHNDTTQKELIDLFKSCGPIYSAYVADHLQRPFKYGFVRFTDAQSALTATQEMNGWPFMGRHLVVELASETHTKMTTEGYNFLPSRNSTPGGASDQSEGKLTLENLLMESWIHDCCRDINVALNQPGDYLDAEHLLSTVKRERCTRTNPLHGHLFGEQIEAMSWMRQCILNSEKQEKLPPRTSSTFTSVLKQIVENSLSVASDAKEGETPVEGEDGKSSTNKLKTHAKDSESETKDEFVTNMSQVLLKLNVVCDSDED